MVLRCDWCGQPPTENRGRFHYRSWIMDPGQWPVRDWPAPIEVRPGPVRQCWSNARAIAATDPSRYAYAEGLVWLGDHSEEHGWVVDRERDAVIEATGPRYVAASRYRGLTFPRVPAGDHGVILALFEQLHWCELTTRELVRDLRQALDDS